MKYLYWKRVVAASGVLLPGLALAQTSGERAPADTTKNKRLGSVEVRGELRPTSKTALSAEATASPASVTLVGRDFIARQAVTSYGDLLRPLGALNVTNFQLGGVGYGVQMRGYVGTEHAKDIAFNVDGVPQNQGSDIQANGYVDLFMLIPETMSRIEVVRGPNSPFYGDHDLGGSVRFNTNDRMASSVSLSAGTYGTVRALGIAGFGPPDPGRGGGYVALEENYADGYRDNSRTQRLNGLAKYSFPLLSGLASVKAQVFSNDFGSANYLNRAWLDAGLMPRRSALSLADGGSTRQQNATLNYRGSDASNYWSFTAYVVHHQFNRYRVGQPAMPGGPNGAQRKERNARVWEGFDLHRTGQTTLLGMPTEGVAGLSFRGDEIELTRFVTVNRNEITQVQSRDVNTYTPSAYGSLQLKPLEALKVTLSARYDKLFYRIRTGDANVETDYPSRNITASPGVFSPKLGLAYSLSKNFSLFGNYAQGFKAPSGYEENIDNPDLSVSKLQTYEVGLSADNASGRLHGLASVYRSNQSGEVQNDPVSNALINFGHTLRQGVEVEGRVRFGESLGSPALFGNYTRVLAELRNGDPQTLYVTTVPDFLALLGLDYTLGAATNAANQLTLSVYDQLVGPKNLLSDASLKSPTFQRVGVKLAYTRPQWADFRVFAESTFYPDGSHGLDEASFVSGGVLVTAPQTPFTFTAGVKIPL